MPRIPLTSGAYSASSIIANAQRCVNLYVEANPQDSNPPVPVTHYPRPGLTPLSTPPSPGRGRGLYTATNGELFAVVDQNIYHIHYEDDWSWHLVGTMLQPGTVPVSMADNGSNVLVVDSSATGYNIDISSGAHVFSQIGDPNFIGATRADYLDSFLIVNQPNSPNWYCTESNSMVFNALYYGVKTAWPDNIQTVIAIEREVWVLMIKQQVHVQSR